MQTKSVDSFREHLVEPILALTIVVMGTFFMSCAVQVDAVIAANRKASIQMQVGVHPVLQAYLADLAGNGSDGKPVEIFDADRIRARLAEEPGVTVRGLEASLKKGITMNLEVADLQKLFASKNSNVNNVFTLSTEGGSSLLRIRLDRSAVESFIGLGLEKNDTSLRYLLPQNASLTADKYRENLRWALEEYGTKDQLTEMFRTSTLSMRLTVPGAIKSSSGFVVSDKAAGKLQLNLSLLDLMTLQGSRLYEARY